MARGALPCLGPRADTPGGGTGAFPPQRGILGGVLAPDCWEARRDAPSPLLGGGAGAAGPLPAGRGGGSALQPAGHLLPGALLSNWGSDELCRTSRLLFLFVLFCLGAISCTIAKFIEPR